MQERLSLFSAESFHLRDLYTMVAAVAMYSHTRKCTHTIICQNFYRNYEQNNI